MTNNYRHHSAIALILISLCCYTPGLPAWDGGHQGGSDQNVPPQTGGDADKKGIVHRERPANTPVYNVEMAKPHPPAMERPPMPVPPVPDGRMQHARPLNTPNSNDNSPPPFPHIQRQTPDRDTAQPRPSFGQKPALDRPDNLKPTVQPPFGPGGHEAGGAAFRETPPQNPFDADKHRHDTPPIKPVFEPHERPGMNSGAIRPSHEVFRDNRGRERPAHGPIIVEKIRPARGMGFYREMPAGHQRVFVRNQWYFSHEGRYYRRTSDGFIWIVPPPGLVVTTLPFGCTSFLWGGVEYYTYAGIYYRPTYGGYVVVEEPEDLPSPWAMDPPPVDFVLVNTELLNVRSGPGEDFPVIEQAMYGERLQVLGSYDDWYYIRLANGRKGWVLAYFTYPENQAEPMG